MSTPNPEEEVERLSQVIENLNFVNATQAAELSMKNGHLAHAKEIYSEAIRERDDLRQWKESMMQVESKWDEQKIGRLLKLPLGVSVRASLQPAIEKLIEEKEALRSGCLSDPLLKATVDPLLEQIAALEREKDELLNNQSDY